MSRLSYLLTLTPRETWRIVRHKLPVLKNGPPWTADELLSSAKHSRGIRFAELLMRQEAVVRRAHPQWTPLTYDGRRIVEVGCGPLAGFGPLAIFCGAKSFESAEPEWNESLFFSPPVVEKYLKIFYADLVGLYGPRMSFEEFLKRLHDRLKIERCGFEAAAIAGPVDVVLSQSVLEHVFPLEATIAKLAEIQSPKTQFLHLVDFGNHYPTASPFEGLYRQPAEAYIVRRGRAINCLRMPDVAKLFAKYRTPAAVVPSRVMDKLPASPVHSWWLERYDEEVLRTQLALVAGPLPAA